MVLTAEAQRRRVGTASHGREERVGLHKRSVAGDSSLDRNHQDLIAAVTHWSSIISLRLSASAVKKQ